MIQKIHRRRRLGAKWVPETFEICRICFSEALVEAARLHTRWEKKPESLKRKRAFERKCEEVDLWLEGCMYLSDNH